MAMHMSARRFTHRILCQTIISPCDPGDGQCARTGGASEVLGALSLAMKGVRDQDVEAFM